MSLVPDFWKTIEDDFKCEIPTYIKLTLSMCGYDNPISLQNLDENLIDQIGKSVQELFPIVHPEATIELKKDFLGIFFRDVNTFKFLKGHVILILEISKYIKQKINTNPLGYFFKRDNPAEKGDSFQNSTLKLQFKKTSDLASNKTQEDKVPKEIDIEGERKKCFRILNLAFKNIGSEKNIYEKFTVSNIEVKLEENEEDFEYVGLVTCPFCNIIIKVKQYSISKNNNTRRWSRNNFERHLKTHLELDKEPKSIINKRRTVLPNSQMKISNIFKNMTKPSKEVTVDDSSNLQMTVLATADPTTQKIIVLDDVLLNAIFDETLRQPQQPVAASAAQSDAQPHILTGPDISEQQNEVDEMEIDEPSPIEKDVEESDQDQFEERDGLEKVIAENITKNLQKHDFVLVKYITVKYKKKNKYFVGQVINIDSTEISISCMRKSSSKNEFIFPVTDDVDLVGRNQIVLKLTIKNCYRGHYEFNQSLENFYIG